MNQNNSFALHCVHILEPREFAIGRRNNVPLYREIIILNEDQYENAIRNPDEPVRPRGEIRLIGGLIIPGLSYETLHPTQLVRRGGDKDPLDVNIRIQNEEQYENAIRNDGPVPPRVQFHLIGGFIIPELSDGLGFCADFERLPLHDQQNPERLWKLQRDTTHNYTQMYPEEIKIALKNAYNGHYLIRPAEPVRLETFRQMLRCLPWLKMFSYEELMNGFY